MTHFDVLNGDADGLCALQQLRLAQPREAIVVTGPKRAIELVGKVEGHAGDSVTVLDLSFDANRAAVEALLAKGVLVEYFDHHFAGAVPQHARLVVHLDAAPDTCTGMIVDRVLGGTYRAWAIVAAYGDNLPRAAARLGASMQLDDAALQLLRDLGEDLAYNAYGDDEEDLLISPLALVAAMRPYKDPWTFVAREAICERLRTRRTADLALARAVAPRHSSPRAIIVILPPTDWSRRVRGALANELVNEAPDRACAVLSPARDGRYTVSVRAARRRPAGADAFCRSFASGGGRAAAGGINHLSVSEVDDFVARFRAALA